MHRCVNAVLYLFNIQDSPIVETPKNSDQTQTNKTPSTSDITKPIPTPEKKEEDTVLPQESTQNNSAKTTVKAQVEGYKGEVQSCNRAGESVTCDVFIISTKKDSSTTRRK